MGRFRKGQIVVVIETGEICTIDVISGGIIWLSNSNRPHSESQLKATRLHTPWQQNTILDVGAKSLIELPAADKAARIANRAIERMINQ